MRAEVPVHLHTFDSPDAIYSVINIGPATRCDAVHPQWDVPKLLRYIKIICDVLRCIFQHVGTFAPDFRISQPFIIRFSNSLQYCDGYSISYHVVSDSKLAVEYF